MVFFLSFNQISFNQIYIIINFNYSFATNFATKLVINIVLQMFSYIFYQFFESNCQEKQKVFTLNVISFQFLQNSLIFNEDYNSAPKG